MYQHKWSLFSARAPLGTTCSLYKRVCSYQLASSSDLFGSFFFLTTCQGHVSSLWVKLMTADCVCSSCTAALTDCKGGVSSHSPLFSVALAAWITLLPEWRNSWGSGCPSPPFTISFPKCWGKLEGRRLRLQLEHSWEGLLHRTRALREPATPYTQLFLHTPQHILYCLEELLLLRVSP